MNRPRPIVFVGASSEAEGLARAIEKQLKGCCAVGFWRDVFNNPGESTLGQICKVRDAVDFAVLMPPER